MKNESSKMKSPYLAHKMSEIVGKTGMSIQELAEKVGLSYSYMRRIANGMVVPNRDALKKMCEGLGWDFAVEWAATHPIREQQAGTVVPMVSREVFMDSRIDLSVPGEKDAAHAAMRRRMNQIMDTLSLEEMLDLLIHARSIADGSGSSQDRYRNMDEDGRHFRWEELRTAWSGPALHYSVLGVEGDWRYPQEQVEQFIKEGRVAIPPGRKIPRLKVYLNESI